MLPDQNNPGGIIVPFTTHQQVRVGENEAYPQYKGAYATFLNIRLTGLARIALHHTWTQNKHDLPIDVPPQCLEAIRCDCHLEIDEEAQRPLAALLYHSLTGDASYLVPALKRGERGLFCCMPCFVRLEQSRLASLWLSHTAVEPMKAQDYRLHSFCAHCTVFASWRVQEKNPTGTPFLSLSVCEDDVIRYQPRTGASGPGRLSMRGCSSGAHVPPIRRRRLLHRLSPLRYAIPTAFARRSRSPGVRPDRLRRWLPLCGRHSAVRMRQKRRRRFDGKLVRYI